MNIVIRSSKTVRCEVRPGCPLHCFTYSLSFSNHFHLPIFRCRATCRGLNFSAKVICPSQSCQCRCSAASEPQKSSSPLSSVFLRISLVRLFLSPSECRKNHPDGRKQAEQWEKTRLKRTEIPMRTKRCIAPRLRGCVTLSARRTKQIALTYREAAESGGTG